MARSLRFSRKVWTKSSCHPSPLNPEVPIPTVAVSCATAPSYSIERSSNANQEVSSNLRAQRLSGILDSLEVRNRQAVDGQMAYSEFLAMLLQDEVARRDQRKLDALLRQAADIICMTSFFHKHSSKD